MGSLALPRFRAAPHCSSVRGTKPKRTTMGEPDSAENSSFNENCTLWGISCVQADLENPLLNPFLWPPSTLVFWGEGLALPALALAALVANVVLLRLLVCRLARPGDWLMTLLADNSILLLATITILRTPQALGMPFLPPQAVTSLTVLQRALTNFITLLFVIFVGDRHLRQLEQVSYEWLKPVLFCFVISILAAVPFIWEVALVTMSREEIDQHSGCQRSGWGGGFQTNSSLAQSRLQEHGPTSSACTHFSGCNSLVAPHATPPQQGCCKGFGEAEKKGRSSRPSDRLLPTLAFVFILLTLPNLADLVIQILLFRTPPALHVVQILSTCLLLLLIPLLTLIIDPEMRYRLAACSLLRYRVQVPTEDY